MNCSYNLSFRDSKTEEIIEVVVTSSDNRVQPPVDFPDTLKEISIVKSEKEAEKEGEGYNGSEDSDSNHNKIQGIKIPIERRPYYESTEKYRKTLRLSSEQIVSFVLVVNIYK